jgi:prolyl-tRNA editing enzyme YbaK/EbsC (Cys-tRNA(Pro) deacylase)
MRDPIEQRVIEHLDALEAAYELVEIDPSLADTAAFCEHYGYSLDLSANAILVASRRPPGVHAVGVVLATNRLDVNKTLCRLMGVKRASFAPPDPTRDLTGMEIGGVTPFGLPPGVPVYVDDRVAALDRCIVGGGSRSLKVIVDPEVFGRMEGVEVVAGLGI